MIIFSNTLLKKIAVALGVTTLMTAMITTTLAQNKANQSALPFTPEQLKVAQALMDEALKSDLGYQIVESLTTEVGARLGGSEAERRARSWGVKLGKQLGFDRVIVEAFTMPFWERGNMHIALTAPYHQPLYGSALGGSGYTKKMLNAEIVYFRSFNDITQVKAGQLRGRIAFIDGDFLVKSQTGGGYAAANKRRQKGWQYAQKGGAVALVVRSVGSDSHRFPHTGMMNHQEGKWATIPVIAVSNPDADHLRRLHRLNKKLKLSISSEARWKGNVNSGNVILDLIGSEKPEEIILIGAHLDSWDQGTGAIDDGAGVAITTAAAKLIAQLPQRPKRTIRVVMFGAEEVGLLGAKAYAKKHAETIEQHILATESDFGAGKIWQLNSNVNAQANAFIDAIGTVIAPLGIVRGGNGIKGGGPDIIPLDALGVPTIRLSQSGMDYFDLHHTPDDTLDKINLQDLAQNVAAYAATIYLLADSDVDFRIAK